MGREVREKLTQENTANQLKHGTGNIPRVVVARLPHVLAVDQVKGDKHQDKGEQVDGRLDGVTAARELVV